MKTHVIRIDAEVEQRILEWGKHAESPNATLRRYLGLPATQERRSKWRLRRVRQEESETRRGPIS
jgi:hypothetical protein